MVVGTSMCAAGWLKVKVALKISIFTSVLWRFLMNSRCFLKLSAMSDFACQTLNTIVLARVTGNDLRPVPHLWKALFVFLLANSPGKHLGRYFSLPEIKLTHLAAKLHTVIKSTVTIITVNSAECQHSLVALHALTQSHEKAQLPSFFFFF